MGSVLSGVGNAVGSIFGDTAHGLGEGLGAFNSNQYGGPYDPQVLQDELTRRSQIYGGQQNLAQALQAQMAGQGPNPAQTQFMGNTQNNIANAQGLIASQRGLNPALAARLGANAAANANQQAALGSALLQQQQQLGATANLGNLYEQMQQGNLGQQQLYVDPYSKAQQLNAKVNEQNTNTQREMAGGMMNSAMPFIGKGISSVFGGGGSGATALAGGPMDAGGISSAAMLAAHGAIVPGKARVPGDSIVNDTVTVKLSPGEIVVPRSMAHDPEKAKEFIDHLLKENKKSGAEYGDVLKARRNRKK